jgi:single-stranded-DNA-specific exonuclease
LDHKTKPSEDKIKHLAQALHVEDFVATLLVQRGIETFEDAKNFRPSLDHLHDPYLMKDMDKAGNIEAAIENQENIMVLVITMSMEQPQYHWYLLT